MSKALKKLIDINGLREFKNKLVGAGSAYVQTAAVDQTVAGTKTFSKPIVGSVTGNAATATKATQDAAGNTITTTYATKAHTHTKVEITDFPTLATVATSGSYTDLANKPAIPTVNNATLTIQKNGTTVKTFTANASANVTANITVPTKVSELTNDSGFLTSHQSLSNYVTLNGAQTISGAKTFTGNIIGINKERSTEDANSLYSTTAGSKLTYYTTSNGGTTLTNVPATVNTTLESRTIRRLSDSDWIVEQICHNSNGLYYRKGSNGTWGAWKTFAFTDSNISGNAATATTAATAKACTGNAATATKLQTARTINGTSFNGTANITTANWGTARNISITDGTNTSTAVSVNGSANVSLKLPATIKANLTGNSDTATKATQDSAGQQIDTTYIKGLAVSGRTITYTKGDNTTGTITTQDTNTWTAFKGATASANGTAGYVPAPTKGNQGKFFKADGTWATPTNTTYSNMKGATASTAGTAGLVPAPAAGTQAKYLRGDGTWATPPNTTYASMSASEATTGTATAARTISAKVLHDKINSNLSAYATKTELNNGLATKANNSEVVHKSGDETIAGTKTFSSNIVGNVTGNASTATTAATATNATYANWLRTSSHSDHLFHTEWDKAGYFWTYVTTGNGDYRAVRVARSDSAATAQACTGNAATATKATQDSDGNKITTTYSKVGHTHDDRYYTETEVNNLLNGKANNSEVVHKSGDETIAGTKTFSNNVHASGFHATDSNALMAQRGEYTLVLRNDGDNTYLLMSDKGGVPGTWSSARPLVISNSTGVCDINGNAATATTAANADHATSADSATKAIMLKSNSSAYHEIRFDWSRQVNGRVGIRVDAVDLGGIATTSGTYGGMTVGSATRATQDSDGHQISTTYIKRTDAVSYNIGACFIGFYSSASHISNIGNGGRLAVGATTSASNLYDTIATTNSNTVVCSRNITLAGVWKLISVIKYNVFSENYAIVESTHQAGSSFAAGVVAVQGLFVRVS